jgi:hypothetical protein
MNNRLVQQERDMKMKGLVGRVGLCISFVPGGEEVQSWWTSCPCISLNRGEEEVQSWWTSLPCISFIWGYLGKGAQKSAYPAPHDLIRAHCLPDKQSVATAQWPSVDTEKARSLTRLEFRLLLSPWTSVSIRPPRTLLRHQFPALLTPSQLAHPPQSRHSSSSGYALVSSHAQPWSWHAWHPFPP